MITGEQFFQYLRSALNHLYDPYFLHKSPLVKVFNLGDQPDTPAALQRILNDAIAALEPRPGEANLAQRKRNYELIMYRYVQQFDQEEVSNQLGLSVRHLRREQNVAIYALAAFLWESYRLGARPLQLTNLEGEDPAAEDNPAPEAVGADLAQAAGAAAGLDWLEPSPLEASVDLETVLSAVVELSRPLAQRYAVDLQLPALQPGAQNTALAIHEVALRQILLNVLSVAIRSAGGGRIEICQTRAGAAAEISLPGSAGRLPHPDEDMRSSLSIAAELAGRYGGSLRHNLERPEPLRVTISLPLFQRTTLLVIDDNPDFVQLVERTLTGLRYAVLHQHDPLQALESAIQTSPDFILLDVMMPRVDGWEVLSRLRRHPETARIPVIICTILPQEDLALSLGAAAFLRKPATPEKILAALERLPRAPADH